MAYATQTRAEGGSILEKLGELRASLADRLAKYTIYRQTMSELSALSDRDLADLGVSRADITRLAREAAWGN